MAIGGLKCVKLGWTTFILALSTVQPKAQVIDWVSKIIKTEELARNEYENYEIARLARDNFAPGFVRITPYSITEGDFDALTNHLSDRRSVGDYEIGPPQIVWSSNDAALMWRRLSFNNGTTTREGINVILYVVIGDEIKRKFIQMTV